jgi:2-methylcitrate dehydratase PrpD
MIRTSMEGVKLEAYTRDLAEYAAATRFEELPAHTVERAKLCILDWLGCNLVGQTLRSGRIIIGTVGALGGTPESTVVGSPVRTASVHAAYANGWLGHVHDFDDDVAGCWLHGACIAIPGTLAVAEGERLSGRALIAGVVVGYDVASRVARCVNTEAQHQVYWHTTATAGTFGAAAAAANLLALSGEEAVHALGEAGNQAMGLSLVYGTMSKHSNPGRACRNGVMAALLAKRGLRSTRVILESPIGFCKLMHKESEDKYDLDLLTEGLGRESLIMQSRWKRYPSCGHTHNPIDAALRITRRHDLDPDEVTRIDVRTNALAVQLLHPPDSRSEKYRPRSPEEAKFSFPYTVGAALYRRRFTLAELTEQTLGDPVLLKLVKKVEVSVDPELDEEYRRERRTRVHVRVETRTAEHVEESAGPVGLETRDELTAKFRRIASSVLPARKVREILASLARLEDVEDIRQFTRLLRTRPDDA